MRIRVDSLSEIEELMKIIKDHEKRISKLESSKKGSRTSKPQKPNRHKSITDLLTELKTEGFFKQPKFVNEIVERLAEKTYYYSGSSLTSPLQRAVRSGILGRIKKEGAWAWVAR